MAILIDGYNLMHAAGLGRTRYGPGGLEKARRALLGALAAALGPDAQQAMVVFDAAGAPPDVPQQYQYQGLQVRFAASHSDADALLEELIQADSAPRRLTVVSSDRQIQRAARRRRAHAVDSEKYLAELHERRKRNQPRRAAPRDEPSAKHRGVISPAELDYWLKEFQVPEERSDADERHMPDVTPLKNGPRKPARRHRKAP